MVDKHNWPCITVSVRYVDYAWKRLFFIHVILVTLPLCVCCASWLSATWVEARQTARMTVGTRGRKNSVAVRPPLPLHRPHRRGAGWPAAGAGGPVAEAILAPETKTGGEESHQPLYAAAVLSGEVCLSQVFPNIPLNVLSSNTYMPLNWNICLYDSILSLVACLLHPVWLQKVFGCLTENSEK